jgi:tetratricopeptide (TPR) repeat protein
MARVAAVLLLLGSGCGARSVSPPALGATLQEGISAAMAGDLDRARDRLGAVAAADPDGMHGAIAWDSLRELAGQRVLPIQPPTCSEAATREYVEAERLLIADNAAAAVERFERAVAGCPENGFYWIHSGDAQFRLGDLERASELYREGLKRQPWERSAHRFLADAELQLGHIDNARHAAILAVVSDPTYEAGWATLRLVNVSAGGIFKRVRGYPPDVSFSPDERPQITVHNPPGSDAQGDVTAWLAYALIEFDQMRYDRGLPASPELTIEEREPPPASPIERELQRVNEALEVYGRFIADNPNETSRFWQMMSEANGKGFLTEAVFIHFLDQGLAGEYVEFREHNLQRLIDYIDTLLVPLPNVPRSSPRAV